MGTMVIQQITILSLLIIQAFSAPTGCIESCSSYYKQYQTSGNFQDHGLQSTLQGADYSRPGTWSEHNDYNVDNGHGKVYEERGQYVTGPKTVRYYKKNYTSSYSTGYGGGLSNDEHQNSNYRQGVLIPNVYNQAGSESTSQQHSYNSMQSQQHMQSSIRRTGVQSERLEDFGEQNGNIEGLQQSQFGTNIKHSQVPYYTETRPGNWSKVDSYKTDGGQGRVFEEEGQYLSGGKKVRYYKKNYTSSHSSYGGIPEPVNIGIPDIQKEIDKLHREIGKEISQTSSVHSIGSSDAALTNLNTYDSSNLHNANSNKYRNQNNYQSSSSMIHNEQQQSSTNEYLKNPRPNSYGANSYSVYEKHEGRVMNVQPGSQIIHPTSGYTSVLNTGSSGHASNTFNTGTTQQETHNIQQAEHLDTHQSALDQSEMFSDNVRQSGYNQNSAIQSGMLGQAAHYKEHWSSSHTKEASVPQYTSGISHMQYSGSQYENGQGMHQSLQQDDYLNQLRENRFNSAQRTHLGKLVTGTLDLSQTRDTVDCDDSQHSSRYNRKYKRGIRADESQHLEDLTQQTSEQDDYTQQTSGKLELEQESQQSYQPRRPSSANQQSEDLTQQISEIDDLTQQISGKLEFGQESQQSYQPWRPGSANQQSEDLTQQTGDDLTQQTSGKLEFGQESQQSYQPWRPGSANQQSEDLTQQTGDDLTQQTSGKLEFGQESQQSYQPWRPGSANQQSEDLTQQTGDDLTQQTSGKLEFGQESQQSYQPWRPGSANQQSEDLTQQTGDDLTQQTSGKLEFGQESQQSYQPWRPGRANQQSEDLTQQTGDDLTQQTSGKLEFGQQTYQPWKPDSANQQSEDSTKQTSEQDDLTQQISGKLELGQQSNQPWHLGSANQQSEDLTQQTSQYDDLTQQTSGKLEFGQESQQSYQPWRPGSANQQSEDLTQQTGQYDDFTQQTSGKLEFGQQSNQPWKPGSANQQSEDLTQQTSGKLEFGQESQQSYQPWKPHSANQQSEDLTQQTAGELEFGQESQQTYHPGDANQQSADLTQQTSQYDDFTQQTSGNLEFGRQSVYPWRPYSANQQSEDLTQQTSGNFELGQESQQSYQPWKPSSTHKRSDDLHQQSGKYDDLTQQTSGNLEFGQQSYQPWKPNSADQQSEDLTQQTSASQQSYQPWKPGSANQYSEDLTQQTGLPDDFSQQSFGKLEFGQQSQIDKTEQGISSHIPKPAEKPKPRSRYSRVGSVDIYELPPYIEAESDDDKVRNQDIRGDQTGQNSDKNISKDLDKKSVNAYNVEGENVDQANWLHKSNDATVGLQWHYTYHPSDHRQFVQQTDQKDKDQQRTSEMKFSNLPQTSDQQETQDKYLFDDLYQQSSNQENQESQSYLQSQDAFGQTAKFDQGTVDGTKEKGYSTLNQQVSENANEEKHIRSSETVHQLEPRILEAYGGGPYDVSHSDDIYHGITVNPTVTLPPINNADPWDIREKPRETETTPPPMPVEPLVIHDPTEETTPPPSFWSKLGHKITNTFDKAKEKARNIFG